MAGQKTTVSQSFNIEELTIAQLQRAMDEGMLTAADLVKAYKDRIEQFDAQLNAFISINPKALEQAVILDQSRANGNVRGCLHGIPVVVKDNINTSELPTTGGCIALANMQATEDAFVVAKLKEAGAIILGKANLHELACRGESVSGLGGQVHNPYNLAYTPGGSSGGTAAAIAANLAACGLGSDTINSVRSPASACNIVGLRPTAGRVSRSGLMPISLTQDTIGPMGRTVEDVATLLEVISQDDPNDPMTARSVGHSGGQQHTQESNNYVSGLSEAGLAGKTLGVVASLWGDQAIHQGVNSLVEDAIATMGSLGAQTVKLAVNIDVEKMAEELSMNIWEGKLHFEQYLESLGNAAPIKTMRSLIDTEKVHASIVPILEIMDSVDTPLGYSEYWQRLYIRRAELRQRLFHLFSEYQIDALIYPHQKQPVARIGEQQKGRNGFLAAASGFPAITFPVGFVDVAEGSVPVGVELMGRPFEEGNLLQMAYAYEKQVAPRRSPSGFSVATA